MKFSLHLKNCILIKLEKKGTFRSGITIGKIGIPNTDISLICLVCIPEHILIQPKTPALAKACEQTLIDRGDETTGWSKGWRINLWAKLYNGEKAYKMYRELLRYVDPSGLETNYSDGGGTYPNLFDAHPPFQIDGNFGGAAAVLEMIAQSNEDEILLLPALPSAWNEGKLQGVCARNGFELDVEWSQGKLDKVTVRSKAGKPCMLVYGDKRVDLETVKGEEYRFGSDLARL